MVCVFKDLVFHRGQALYTYQGHDRAVLCVSLQCLVNTVYKRQQTRGHCFR